jgi:hypothetical protein
MTRKSRFCRAISQAVSRWLPSAAARFRARGWSSGICGGQSGAGAGFLRVLWFPLSNFIPQNSPYMKSPGAGSGRRAEWTQYGLHPPLSECLVPDFNITECDGLMDQQRVQFLGA